VIQRPNHVRNVLGLLSRHPVVAILGARQVGKSTLARQVWRAHGGQGAWFDLEFPDDLSRLADPSLTLGRVRGLVVLDELHRRPDLFPVLRVLADRPRTPCRFLVLGSASPELLRQGAETLAGRIATYRLSGFSLDEVRPGRLDRLWVRGGFPRSFLAPSDRASVEWRREFVSTFLERDLPQLGVVTPSATLGRFWAMLAHRHAQVWNASEFGRSFGVADTTVRRYLDLLASTYVVRVLLPWHENIGKRQVSSPKVYIADSGLLHSILGLGTLSDLEAHPTLGASWEGFVVDSVLQALAAAPQESFFWGTHAGAELDLLVVRGRRRWGFEVKRTSAPSITKSMRIASSDLSLDRLFVVHAGKDSFDLAPRIRALAAVRIAAELAPAGPRGATR